MFRFKYQGCFPKLIWKKYKNMESILIKRLLLQLVLCKKGSPLIQKNQFVSISSVKISIDF